MRRLRVITPEEQRILDGGSVDKAAYTARAVLHGVGIGGIGVEPDVPFVEAEVDVFLCALLRFDEIARGDDGTDEVIHIVALGEEVCGIVEAVAVVLVQGDVIDAVIRPRERGVFPLRECGHARAGACLLYTSDAADE